MKRDRWRQRESDREKETETGTERNRQGGKEEKLRNKNRKIDLFCNYDYNRKMQNLILLVSNKENGKI